MRWQRNWPGSNRWLSLCLLLFIGTATLSSIAAQSTTSPSGAVADGRPEAPSQSERVPDKAAKDRLAVCYGMRKSDWRRLTAGYWDPQTSTFYEWRGLRVDRSDLPRDGMTQSLELIHLDAPGIKVVEDEPVEYLLLLDGRLAPGYYDPCLHYFYRWEGVILDGGAINATGARVHDRKTGLKVVLVPEPERRGEATTGPTSRPSP